MNNQEQRHPSEDPPISHEPPPSGHSSPAHPDSESLIPRHGGYRNLKSFQMAQLIYDVTVWFCGRHIDRRSRTHDQMVQAARSGVQNIAEGSQASGTSRKSELKLTNVARASLEELRLDYEDFLRQRGLELWPAQHPALQRFKAKRCATVQEFTLWIAQELAQAEHQPPCEKGTGSHGHTSMPSDTMQGTNSISSSAQLEANAALSLLNLCCHLLGRQISAQADAFLRDGGFTERLYHTRSNHRRT